MKNEDKKNKLSRKERVKRVYNYLVNHGVDSKTATKARQWSIKRIEEELKLTPKIDRKPREVKLETKQKRRKQYIEYTNKLKENKYEYKPSMFEVFTKSKKQFNKEYKPVVKEKEVPFLENIKPKRNKFGNDYPDNTGERVNNWVFWSKNEIFPNRILKLVHTINNYYGFDKNDKAGYVIVFNAYYYNKDPFEVMKQINFSEYDHSIYTISEQITA